MMLTNRLRDRSDLEGSMLLFLLPDVRAGVDCGVRLSSLDPLQMMAWDDDEYDDDFEEEDLDDDEVEEDFDDDELEDDDFDDDEEGFEDLDDFDNFDDFDEDDDF